jgi:hypothetical protein
MAVRLSALHTGRALFPRNIIFLLLVLISVRGWVGLKELGKLNKNHSAHRLLNPRPSACNILPQSLHYRVPAILPRVYQNTKYSTNFCRYTGREVGIYINRWRLQDPTQAGCVLHLNCNEPIRILQLHILPTLFLSSWKRFKPRPKNSTGYCLP